MVFPAYLGKIISRIKVGRRPPKIEVALIGTPEDVLIFQATRTERIELWGFGLEFSLLISERNIKELLEIIVLSVEGILHVMVEGRHSTYYGCGGREHTGKDVPYTFQMTSLRIR